VFFFCRAFQQFKEAINDEDFEDLLKDAQADPKGVAAQDLPKKVLPFLIISGRQVPWGNVERNAEVTKLIFEEHRWHGPDIAKYPRLRDRALAAIETQLVASLPLGYHLVGIALKVLRVSARRDVAAAVPSFHSPRPRG